MMFKPGLDTLAAALPMGARLGFDLVQVSGIEDSITRFGPGFTARFFTRRELAYADSGAGLKGPRLAARFAAKEAVIKALDLSEAGVDWRDIEVVKLPHGDCRLCLHRHVRAIAARMGASELLLSLSHDGDYAGAVVTVLLAKPATKQPVETLP